MSEECLRGTLLGYVHVSIPEVLTLPAEPTSSMPIDHLHSPCSGCCLSGAAFVFQVLSPALTRMDPHCSGVNLA